MKPDGHIAEARRVVKLGGPIIAAQLFQMGMGVMDTLMAGRHGSSDLAGVAIAQAVFFPGLILVMGALGGITPIVAQMFGAGRVADAGALVRQGFWLAAGIASVGGLILANGDAFVGVLSTADNTEAILVAEGYLEAVVWGIPGLAVYSVLRGTCEGLGRTRPAMVVAGVMLGVNFLLNYAFIFGNLGAPELGGVGCGVATAIVFWLEAIAMALVVRRREYASAGIFTGSWRPQLQPIVRMLRIGLPIALTTFFEMGLYSLVTLLLAEFGEVAVAAHAIAMNINGIAFMIPMGLGIAAGIRVGHCVGAGDIETARLAGQATFRMALAFAAVVGVVLLAVRHAVVMAYTPDPAVQALAANILIFVALYQLVDDTQVTAIGTLRGYKDTRTPMVYAMIGYWLVALPVALVLGYGWLPAGRLLGDGLGIYGFWGGLTAGLAFVAVALNLRRARLARDETRIARLATEEGHRR